MIFVGLVAFKDLELDNTVKDIFAKADKPEEVVVGIVNQDETIYKYNGEYKVKVLHEKPADFLGYCGCRVRMMELYNDEEYYLQVAPHSMMKKGWDSYFVKQLNKYDKKTILCRIPWDVKVDRQTATEKGIKYIKTFGMPDVVETEERLDYEEGKEVYFTYAGQIFCHGQWLKDIPYDPYLWIWGEESDICVRSYAKGYKFRLCENQNWHIYGQKNRGGFHRDYDEQKAATRSVESKQRVFNKILYIKYPDLTQEWDKYAVDPKIAEEWIKLTGGKLR